MHKYAAELTPVVTAVPVGQPAVATAVTASISKPRVTFDPSTGTESWSVGLFDCCGGKDCCSCNGCLQNVCCGMCVYSSAVALGLGDRDLFGLGDLDEQLRCLAVCGGLCCEVIPCQCLAIRALVRLETAKKYGIKEDIVKATLVSCCCCCCADGQVQNELMVREHLKYGCAQMVREPH
jgi:hypothetical protein